MAEAPLPCPFCGRRPKVCGDAARGWYVRCLPRHRKPCPCEPQTDSMRTKADAVAVWNYRPGAEER